MTFESSSSSSTSLSSSSPDSSSTLVRCQTPNSKLEIPQQGRNFAASDRWKEIRDRDAEDFGTWLACESEISALTPVIDRIEAHLIWLKDRRAEMVRERDAATKRMDEAA